MSVPRVVVFVCLVSVLLAAAVWTDAAPVTDQIAAAVALPDGAGVVLDGVYVESVIGGSASVRDTWAHSRSLLTFTDAAVQTNWTVKVTGQMTTIDGQRVLIASAVQLYATIDGSPAPPVPACMLAAMPGVSLVDIPAMPARRGIGVPMNTLESIEEFDGSIPSAKAVGGDVTLGGKVVTAVFYAPGTTDVAAFYIQGPTTGGVGIRVVPEDYPSVRAGETVSVTGTITCGSGDAECYVDGWYTEHVGWASRPSPIGTSQRFAPAGAYGLQPALYKKTTDANPGVGVNLIGTRVRVWGRVTWAKTDGTQCCVDDGTGLESVVDGATRQGIRLIGSTDYPMSYQVGDHVSPATGILGAEMSGVKPVPVLRIPCTDLHPVIHVRPSPAGDDNNSGFDWDHAKASIYGALSMAGNGQEVWAAAGRYFESSTLTIPHGVGLYGGFAGSETARDERNWRTNETFIYGAGYCFQTPYTSGPGFVVDGFTIVAGATGVWTMYGDDISVRHNIIDAATGVYMFPMSTSQRIRVTDNWIRGDAGYGVVCHGNVSRDTVTIANNTFTNSTAGSNSRCAIWLLGTSPTIVNNMVAGTQYGVSDSYLTGAAFLRNNCVFGASTAYQLGQGADNFGGVSSDPLLVGVHISPDSPCLDAGFAGMATSGEKDIDAQARIYGSQVDIGADESTGARLRSVTLIPENTLAIPPASATITATVRDEPGRQTVSACRVDFSVTNGTITAIGGNSVSPPATTGWGTTGSNGTLTVTVLASAGKPAVVTARVVTNGIDESAAESVVYGGVFKVGFLYAACESDYLINPDTFENYFERLADACHAVVYAEVNNPGQGIDSSFNTVFLIMPSLDLTTAQLNAISASLASFVTSGKNKRVVLVGEHNSGFSAYNARLNVVAEAIGMKSNLFSTTPVYPPFDSDNVRYWLCRVESGHYLMQGISGLWDSATDYFVAGWQTYARPLAYLNAIPDQPWMVEQDTATAGSRIAIHDSSFFGPEFNDVFDTVPDKNFRFTRNLCTIFRD